MAVCAEKVILRRVLRSASLAIFLTAALCGCARKEEDVFRSRDLPSGLVSPAGGLFVPADETATDYSASIDYLDEI